LRKGTLIAQDPAGYDDLELEDEKDAMLTGALQKQPMTLYMAIIICSIGTAVQ